MYNTLTNERIKSVDAFRGITILVMVFVNDVAGVSGIPQWMKHMPANADGMTFVDMVFPAFLFIVGMSLPFAINNRLAKGDSFWKLQVHILWRTLGLLVLGVFMVNGESGYNEKAMGMPIALWSLLFYACAILAWNVYRFKHKNWSYMFRALGFAGLLILGFLYRGGENGSHGLQPKWWGILGLIGWAYFFSCMIYQLMRGNLMLLIVSVALCMVWYAISRADFAKDIAVFQWMAARAGHAAHTGIVLSGVVLSLLFFDQKLNLPTRPRFVWVFVFAIAAAIAAYAIRPYYPISKIYATPSWCLYCVAACTILYMLLYWLTDVLKYDRWTSFFKPAASNALLVYILPAIIMYFLVLTGLRLTPAIFHTGMTGVIWSLCFAVFIMVLAMGLNKLKIKLQL